MKDLKEFLEDYKKVNSACGQRVFVIGRHDCGHLGLRMYSPEMMEKFYKNKVTEQLEYGATFTPMVTLDEARKNNPTGPKQTGVNTISESIQFEYKKKFYSLRIDSASNKPDHYRTHLYFCDSQLFLETFTTRDQCIDHVTTFLKDGTK